ncbi:MAG: hypothetical protein R2710_13345 [Acidimicrobiales bacterium]
MFKTTLKSIMGHKARLIGTAFAVILGVSFLVGTLVFTDSVGKAFDNLFASVYEDTDAEVRSTETLDLGFGGEIRSNMDESYAAVVAAVDGVAASDPYVAGTGQIVGADGEPIGNPGQGPPRSRSRGMPPSRSTRGNSSTAVVARQAPTSWSSTTRPPTRASSPSVTGSP